jgi:hypothetical protein
MRFNIMNLLYFTLQFAAFKTGERERECVTDFPHSTKFNKH